MQKVKQNLRAEETEGPCNDSPGFRSGHDAAPNKQKRERQTEIRQRRHEDQHAGGSTILKVSKQKQMTKSMFNR